MVALTLTENLAMGSGPTRKLTRQGLPASHPSSTVHRSSTHFEPSWAFSEHYVTSPLVKEFLSGMTKACGAR